MALSHFMYHSLTFRNDLKERFAKNERPTRLALARLQELEWFLDDITGSDFLMARLGELKQGNRDMLRTARTRDRAGFLLASRAAGRAFQRIMAYQQSPEDFDKTPSAILYLGGRRYTVADGQPVILARSEDSVLQAFLKSDTENPEKVMEKPGLVAESGYNDAPRILKRIKEKYPDTLGQAISLPGRKGQGGYLVCIKRP